mmetsp:Transcript_39352/g.93090  ORF Transcript_39352/g.93090 Transcript_39352/m.93090 type:complete len:297 (-) Transcript_39352:66-956(-)
MVRRGGVPPASGTADQQRREPARAAQLGDHARARGPPLQLAPRRVQDPAPIRPRRGAPTRVTGLRSFLPLLRPPRHDGPRRCQAPRHIPQGLVAAGRVGGLGRRADGADAGGVGGAGSEQEHAARGAGAERGRGEQGVRPGGVCAGEPRQGRAVRGADVRARAPAGAARAEHGDAGAASAAGAVLLGGHVGHGAAAPRRFHGAPRPPRRPPALLPDVARRAGALDDHAGRQHRQRRRRQPRRRPGRRREPREARGSKAASGRGQDTVAEGVESARGLAGCDERGQRRGGLRERGRV